MIASGRVRAVLDDLRAVLVPWLTARALLLAGYLVAVAVADRLVPDGKPSVLTEGLIAWDGTWYRDIAVHGYGGLPDEALRFFPLFPMLGKAFALVTAGREDVALVLIANVASLALAVGVRRLVRFERGNVALADRAVWMVCLFPGAFVLAWGYAEALWLLAAVVAFWGMRSRHWWWAAAAGVVAGASRPLGVVLLVPAAIELARVWRSARNDERVAGLAAVVSPLVGSGAYLAWVGVTYGNFRLPFSTQGPLRGDAVDPVSRIWDGLHQMVGPERFSDGLHVPFAIAFVVLLVLTFRWWPVSYGAFATLVLLAAVGAENLNSLERYGLNAFPLALTLAVLARDERVDKVVTTVLGGGVVALSSMAWLGAYVP